MRYVFENEKEKIKEEILKKAKFQKVMLLYDDSVTNFQIEEIKNLIKNDCIFNSMCLKNFDNAELNKGYKLVIYLCDLNSFLRLDFDRTQFSNLYFSQGTMLPYFVNIGKKIDFDDLIVLKDNTFDNLSNKSMIFNRFYNYIFDIFFKQKCEFDCCETKKEITLNSVFCALNETQEGFSFVDLKILKENQLDYKYLLLIDVILVNAFLCLFQTLKNKNISMVDVYKVARDNEDLIDKFYSIAQDKTFLDLINMNMAVLMQMLTKTKKELLENIFFNFSTSEINYVFEKVKNSVKNDKGILSYLYLFNIFNE